MDAVLKAITTLRAVSLAEPEGVVCNPINWLMNELTKNSQGECLRGTGPFATPVTLRLRGLPCAVTPAIP